MQYISHIMCKGEVLLGITNEYLSWLKLVSFILEYERKLSIFSTTSEIIIKWKIACRCEALWIEHNFFTTFSRKFYTWIQKMLCLTEKGKNRSSSQTNSYFNLRNGRIIIIRRNWTNIARLSIPEINKMRSKKSLLFCVTSYLLSWGSMRFLWAAKLQHDQKSDIAYRTKIEWQTDTIKMARRSVHYWDGKQNRRVLRNGRVLWNRVSYRWLSQISGHEIFTLQTPQIK